MKPLRILHVIDSLGRGGAERQLVNQLLAHDRTLIQPSVVTLNQPLDLAAELRAAGIPVMTLDLPAFSAVPLAILRLIGMIKALQPDLIHTWLSRANIAGRTAAVISGHIPVISAIQAPLYASTIYLDDPGQKRWKLATVRQLDRWSAWLSKAMHVGCSQYVACSTGAALAIPTNRLRVIYNSVNIESAGSSTPKPAKQIIAVGRLVPVKGHKYLIAAMPAIIAKHPDAKLIIVGGGPLQAQLEQQITALGIHGAVKLLGVRDDVPELLANSDLFVFPSLWEGLGVVVLEALAAGLPTIASNIPAIHEIIETSAQGILVPPQNPQALAEAIIDVLNNPEQARTRGAAGRRRVAEQFDISVTIRQWEDLYQQVART